MVALDEFAGFDGEQGGAALDKVTGLGDQASDTAGIGRRHRRRGVLIDGNLAVGGLFVAEGDLADGGELQALPLRLARPKGVIGCACRHLGARHGIAGTAVQCPNARADKDDRAAARQP